MKNLKYTLGVVLAAIALLMQGCTTASSSGSLHSSGQTQNEQVARFGTAESVRQVTFQFTQTGADTLPGSTIGNGTGAVGAGLIGAPLGGMADSLEGGQIGQRAELEITVRMSNDEIQTIIQEADEQFLPGQRVRLLSVSGIARVAH